MTAPIAAADLTAPFDIAALRADHGRLERTLLALNDADVDALSPLWPERLERMVATSFAALRSPTGDAFLLAFDQTADYDSPNFTWFRERYDRFVYVDRVVVDASMRRRGRARALYDALFLRAAAAGHDRIALEINAEPPNPFSDTFHAALGFAPVGAAALADGAKRVRYLLRALAPSRPDHAIATADTCALCGRPMPPGARPSRHHLTPKLKGGARLGTVLLHGICHAAIHSRYTEAELARSLATPDALRADPELARFIAWVRARPDAFHAPTRAARARTAKRR